jgi:hypothetical protein
VLGRRMTSLLTNNPRIVITVAIAVTLIIGSSNWLNAAPSAIDHGMWTFSSSSIRGH